MRIGTGLLLGLALVSVGFLLYQILLLYRTVMVTETLVPSRTAGSRFERLVPFGALNHPLANKANVSGSQWNQLGYKPIPDTIPELSPVASAKYLVFQPTGQLTNIRNALVMAMGIASALNRILVLCHVASSMSVIKGVDTPGHLKPIGHYFNVSQGVQAPRVITFESFLEKRLEALKNVNVKVNLESEVGFHTNTTKKKESSSICGTLIRWHCAKDSYCFRELYFDQLKSEMESKYSKSKYLKWLKTDWFGERVDAKTKTFTSEQIQSELAPYRDEKVLSLLYTMRAFKFESGQAQREMSNRVEIHEFFHQRAMVFLQESGLDAFGERWMAVHLRIGPNFLVTQKCTLVDVKKKITYAVLSRIGNEDPGLFRVFVATDGEPRRVEFVLYGLRERGVRFVFYNMHDPKDRNMGALVEHCICVRAPWFIGQYGSTFAHWIAQDVKEGVGVLWSVD